MIDDPLLLLRAACDALQIAGDCVDPAQAFEIALRCTDLRDKCAVH
jgi:hypothetical protein